MQRADGIPVSGQRVVEVTRGQDVRDAFGRGERRSSALEAIGWRMLERVVGLTPRYLAAVNADTFQHISNVRHGDAAVGAVRVGETRLIDNIIF